MKRKLICILTAVIFLFACFACGGVVKCSLADVQEERVVVLVEETDGNATLLNCMEYLAEKEELDYKLVGSMLTEINGKANTADFSRCWMLYTSDEDMANEQWGVVEYNGERLGSAIVGAEALVVEEDEIYVWVYQGF